MLWNLSHDLKSTSLGRNCNVVLTGHCLPAQCSCAACILRDIGTARFRCSPAGAGAVRMRQDELRRERTLPHRSRSAVRCAGSRQEFPASLIPASVEVKVQSACFRRAPTNASKLDHASRARKHAL